MENKILFMCNDITITHVIRPLLIAKELKKRGHKVYFAFPYFRYKNLLEKEKIPFFKLEAIDREKALEIIKTYKYDTKTIVKRFKKDLSSDLKIINKIKPDLVINDIRWTAKLACYLSNTKYVSILNAYHTSLLLTKHLIPQKYFLSRIIPKKLQKKIFPLTHKFMDYYLGRAIRKLARKYKIKNIQTAIQSLISDRLNLIADTREFFPCKRKNKFHYIGPFLWQPSLPIPKFMNKIDRNKPIIYLTFGTSDDFKLLDLIIKTLSKKYQIIASTGGGYGGEQLSDVENEKVFIKDFIPALKILDKVFLVICHGGNGTIYQALSKGKPLICLPTFYDQEWNSERVEQLGLGRKLNLKNLDAKKLINTIEYLIKNYEVKKRCEEFKGIIKKYQPEKKAADLIEELL